MPQNAPLPWNSLCARTTTTIDIPLSHRILSWILAFQILLALQSPVCSAQGAQRNISIPLVDPDPTQVIYTPFFCNATVAAASPDQCAGAWRSGLSDNGTPIVTSAGQDPATGNILPQAFFRFRASRVYLTMDSNTSATINVTVSSNNITIMNTLQASLGSAVIVNLPAEDISTVTITVLPSPNTVLFTLISLVITTPLNAASTSIFPTLTLPTPTPVSTWFNPTTTSFATSTITLPPKPAERRRRIAQAVGLTVGLGLGLTAISVVAFFYWKKRRRIARLWRRDASRVDFD